ncbi:TPA: alpha-L-fucosidase [Salmonella enterica]|nr:alpha-L-fucosidase [Salmonella enterica]HCL5082569.1 alpha-L-fucosidase [Salmonella enterica]
MSNNIVYFQDYLESNDTINIASADNYSTKHYDGTPRTPDGQSVTNIPAGAWLKFTGSIPAGYYATCMLYASTLTGNQKVEIRLKSLDAAPTWRFSVNTVSVEKFFTETVGQTVNFSEDEKDIDIYFTFPDGFTGYLNWFVFCQNPGNETQEDKQRRMQWFNEARFGHMIHWGAYSVLGRGEWVMNDEHIPKDEYIQEACIPFDPQNYDPEYWAYVIQSTGQKYLTVTTKHHDGFAIFDTNVIDFAPYDVENTATIHASVLRPLAQACRARDIRFCCYYSWLDWANVNEVAIENAAAVDPATINPDDVTRYLSEMKEHLKELIEIFDPALIWFDGSWAAFIDSSVSKEIGNFLRRLSPDIIINDRIGNSAGDFSTAEQSIPAGAQSGPWEACMTINDSWGYNSSDTDWKSTQTLLADLLDCASKGGNLLLNTGPTGDGVIPSACISRLAELGDWMKTWGAAVYNTRVGTLDVSAQPGAYCTVGLDNTLYVTLTERPDNGLLRIDLPVNLPEKVYWLNAPETPVAYQTENGFMVISLPDVLSDDLGVVLAMTFDELPQPRLYPDKALFRSATASDVWNNDTKNYGPQNLIDGNDSTRWAADKTDNVTLTINLNQAESFDRIAFRQYEQRINAFRIDVYSGATTLTSVSGSQPAQNFVAYLPEAVTADRIVLTIISCLDATEPASLFTFSVFNSADALWPVNLPINLAQGAPTSASTVWDGDEAQYSASFATDGNTSTRWAANDNPKLPVTLTVNFLKEETFDLIRINEVTYGDGTTRIAAFTLQTLAEDGETWNDVFSGTDISVPLVLPYLTRSTAVRIVITALTGTGGPSFWEFSVYQTARELTPMTDAELLEAEARLSFEYLWREANLTEGSAGYGLVADTKGSRSASIACSGFALSGLVIAVERGWISYDLAQQRCLGSLNTIYNNVPQYKGFLYHFINMDNPMGSSGAEYSTVDTMLALNGILTAGQYFGGDCATVAQQIFDRVEWDQALDSSGYFTMSWDDNFNMNTSDWGGYAEQFCMYPMALGSTTHAPAQGAELFYSLERKYGHYADSGDLIYVWDGSLFTYQFSHAWLDFRRLWDRQGADWWQNSVNASKANQLFCIDNHDAFPSLDAAHWGLTACHGPSGYNAFGTPPSGYIGANDQHYTDGTVSPSGPIGSLPFMPQDVMAAMRRWYNDPRLWTSYGFSESFNLSSPAPWYCPTNSGLIKGLTLLMIENYRSRLVWDTYMSHPVLQRGLPVIFDNQAPETIFQETDPSIAYSSTTNWWRATERPQSTDGASMVVQTADAWFEFTFNSRNVAYYGERDVDQGDIDFYLDGEYHGTASAWGATHADSDVIYAITDLDPTTHVLKGVKRSGAWMTLDALKTYASHSFDAVVTSTAAAGNMASVVLTLTQGADLQSASNIASWQVDQNASVSAVTLSRDKKTITLSVVGIQDGVTYHLETANVLNEIQSEKLDKRVLTFTCTILPPERVYDDTDPDIAYEGTSWWSAAGRDGSIFYSESMVASHNGDSFSLTFTGTGIAYYCETASDQGDVDIYIDDVLVETVDTRSDVHQASDIRYLNTTLPLGVHTIKGVKRGGTWMQLDALKVYNPGDMAVSSISTDSEDNIIVTFNQALNEAQALDLSHYALDGDAVITAATIDRQLYRVTLTTRDLLLNSSYTLTISGIDNQNGTASIGKLAASFVNREGLVRWYAFDDLAQGVVTESISGDTSATLHGTVSAADGKSGDGCLLSDGGYISLGNWDLLQQQYFTIEAWINPQAMSGSGAIISQQMYGNNDNRLMLYYSGNQLYFSMSSDDNSENVGIHTEGYIYDDGDHWAHVALIRNGDVFSLAVNGNILRTYADNFTQTNNQPVWVGACMSESGSTDQFLGMIDEIRFYDCAVTPDKLVEHYRQLADDNYTLALTNGSAVVTFQQAQPEAPTANNFHCWIKINDEMKVGLPVTSFTWDDAALQATLLFDEIPQAAVVQNITITVQYNELPTKAPLTLDAVEFAAPSVERIALTGECKTREVLTAVWEMQDPAELKENGSTYTWWVGDTTDGEFEQVIGVYTPSMMLLPEHAGKYIRVGVTPRNERFASGETMYCTTTQTVETQEGNPRTDWFMNAKYGVSHHLLPNYQAMSPAVPPDERWQENDTWDSYLSTFDVDSYINAVEALGVGFVMITIDQHSGYNLAPSSVYDSILDIAPGVRSPSQRDLLMEIAEKLKEKGIRLMCYFMGFPPGKASLTFYDDNYDQHSPDRWGDYLVTRTMEVGPFSDVMTREATRMHAAVVKSFGEHYGDMLAGYWFDGMYDTDWFNDTSEQYNINTLIDAARAGNTDRIVAGAGMDGSVYMDFPHGEEYGKPDANGNEFMNDYPTSRWFKDDGYHQWFEWIALGDVSINAGWGVPTNSADGHHYDTDELVTWVKGVTDKQGVVCMDVRVNRFGEIDSFGAEQVTAVCNAVYPESEKK